MSAVVATKERTPLVADALLSAETRVRGVGAENASLAGAVAPLSSTLVWPCWHSYGGTVSGQLVPVNYYDPLGLLVANPTYCPPEKAYNECYGPGDPFGGGGEGIGIAVGEVAVAASLLFHHRSFQFMCGRPTLTRRCRHGIF